MSDKSTTVSEKQPTKEKKVSPGLKVIATTRFTDETLQQFNRYGEKNKHYWYGSPKAAPQSIDLPRGALVVEMNNSENAVNGIGLIMSESCEKRKPIYQNMNWCRYTMRREAWASPERTKEVLGVEYWELLHTLLFKSRQNQKRWSGITGWMCPNPELEKLLLQMRLMLRREFDSRIVMENEEETPQE
jgi:hypothetical protein